MATASLTLVRVGGGSKTVAWEARSNLKSGAMVLRIAGGSKQSTALKIQASQHDTASLVGSAAHAPLPPEASAQAPLIEFEFVGPDNRPGETDPIPEPQYCTAVSGQKLLRDVMLENQVELYGPYGKMMNCEGRGMCGTCLVEILEGAELMNKRTPAEPYYLKLRPDSWRLACQATVGDGTNGGKMKVKRRPQKGNPLM